MSRPASFDRRPESGRRSFLGGLCAAGVAGIAAAPRSVAAADYPTRPIALISPFSPGGPNDIVGRTIAEPLAGMLGQPIVVETVTGAGGLVGTRRLLSAPADGYTLLIGAAYLVTAPHLYKSANFDPGRDLIPLSPPVESLLVYVSGSHGDLKAMIDNARRSGTPIRVAHPGAGTLSHLGSELLRLESQAPMVMVPYRGVGPAITDLMGGHADLLIDGISSSLPQIRAGRLKALCVPDAARNPLLPDVPTTAELGFPSVRVRAWNAIFARAGTPADVVDRLSTEISRIVRQPAVSESLKQRGLEPGAESPAAFRERLATESAHWQAVVRKAGITVE
ncbi:MAG: Bug family tripartite tricarboxylate transporter substrate binding protein [Lautropia sp.]